jgi:hypothetical protein
MEHIKQLPLILKRATDDVFRFLPPRPPMVIAEPGRPGNIYNQFTEFDAQIKAMKPDEKPAWAETELRRYLTKAKAVMGILAEHHAVPGFNPLNPEGKIVLELISEMVKDEDIVRRVLEILRGWPALADLGNQRLTMQFFLWATDAENQRSLYSKLSILAHESCHLEESDLYRAYRDLFKIGSYPFNLLVEGVACLWTEIKWAQILDLLHTDPELRGRFLGKWASAPLPAEQPHPSELRYYSFPGVFRLLELVPLLNLAAAFFGDAPSRITGIADPGERADEPDRPPPADPESESESGEPLVPGLRDGWPGT